MSGTRHLGVPWLHCGLSCGLGCAWDCGWGLWLWPWSGPRLGCCQGCGKAVVGGCGCGCGRGLGCGLWRMTDSHSHPQPCLREPAGEHWASLPSRSLVSCQSLHRPTQSPRVPVTQPPHWAPRILQGVAGPQSPKLGAQPSSPLTQRPGVAAAGA